HRNKSRSKRRRRKSSPIRSLKKRENLSVMIYWKSTIDVGYNYIKEAFFMKGMGNMNNMMRQMQKMQKKMMKAQDELHAMTFEASAGGGMVKVTANGKKETTDVEIQEEVTLTIPPPADASNVIACSSSWAF